MIAAGDAACHAADGRRKGDAGGRTRRSAALGHLAPDCGRRVLRRRRFRAGLASPHHGRYRVIGRGRRALSRGPRGSARDRAPRPSAGDHRSARARFRGVSPAAPDRRDGGPRAADDHGVARLRRADDGHLHQLPDDHGAGPRRSSRLWRHRGRHLFEQRARRPQQFRGRTLGARRRTDRPDAALRLPSRCLPPRYKAVLIDGGPADFSEWGAVGGSIGEACGSYWEVPVIAGVDTVPSSDALKHFGTALASFGSVALFHMPGITAEGAAVAGPAPDTVAVGRTDIDGFLTRFAAPDDKLDVVVFAAPQLSLFEMEAAAQALDGRRVHPDTTVIVATSPEIKHAADRMGITARIETSGAVVAQGICFYQSHAREMAEANGWTRLMTNSAKLVNIIGGYGYRPTLASLERCVASAVAGRVL